MIEEDNPRSGSRSRMTIGNMAEHMKGIADKDQDNESFEYMRRKLWCNVMLQAIGMSSQRCARMSDEAVEKFDKRFGKGEGE